MCAATETKRDAYRAQAVSWRAQFTACEGARGELAVLALRPSIPLARPWASLALGFASGAFGAAGVACGVGGCALPVTLVTLGAGLVFGLIGLLIR